MVSPPPALDGRVIQVQAPAGSDQRVAFLAQIESLEVRPAQSMAKVIIKGGDRLAATVVGTVLGSVAGANIGRDMDERESMRRAHAGAWRRRARRHVD